jgi:hypothetical protein
MDTRWKAYSISAAQQGEVRVDVGRELVLCYNV